MGSLPGLWLTGNTINIMSLGGMALAIGMLVDEATVSIENIHVQMGNTPAVARRRTRQHADGRAAAAGDALHPVGVHSGVHHGDPMRALFMPLALAVGFAMISSYILSSTLVPIVCVWLLKHHGRKRAGLVRDIPRPLPKRRAASPPNTAS